MKNLKIRRVKIICISIVLLCTLGCKDEFFDKKPNTGIVVPSTLDDMTQLLDNHYVITLSSPALGLMSSDEYYYPNLETYNSISSDIGKNCYTWNKDIYNGNLNIRDWNSPYQVIFYTNVVLEQWEKLNTNDKTSEKGRYVKACALFLRSYAFYNLVQIFSPAYNEATANTDPGIPLKLTANINTLLQRSSVKETYSQIINDLELSVALYSDEFPSLNRNRSSKSATFALLSRIYLSMNLYEKALASSNKSLSYYDELIDFNSLNKTANSFDPYNKELIFFNTTVTDYSDVIGNGLIKAAISKEIIALYSEGDLRKVIFFNKINDNYFMKYGPYAPNFPFTGLATDEIYLIKAECLARTGDYEAAMTVLNKLVRNRWDNLVPYPEIHANNAVDAVSKVLLERRKELIWRGHRWSDLKRLNAYGANIVLSRTLGEITYILPPNDPRYVMPIPDDEIALSHIQQNIR